MEDEEAEEEPTVLPSVKSRLASASMPSIIEMSCTSCCVSLEVVALDRSWDSFAIRHGCLETWTLGGSAVILTRIEYVSDEQ